MAIKHLISSLDFSKEDYEAVLALSERFAKEGIPGDLMKNKIVATLFFQPSTRTMTAFQSAIIRAGGGWLGVMGMEGLSMEKGESLADTIMEFSKVSDVIALRHPQDDSADVAAKASLVPVLNCGSGSREHAVSIAFLLDELNHYIGKIEGVTLGLYGTPEINRVSKALLPVLGYFGVKLYVDDLGAFPFPKDVEERAKANGLKGLEYAPLDEFIGKVDCLMVTRGLQKGIIPPDKFPKEKEEEIIKKFKPITVEHMKKLRKDAYLMMFKPLIFEIDRAVDSDPRALYMKKERFVEMALAEMVRVLGIKV